jgi:hypothetical protein
MQLLTIDLILISVNHDNQYMRRSINYLFNNARDARDAREASIFLETKASLASVAKKRVYFFFNRILVNP